MLFDDLLDENLEEMLCLDEARRGCRVAAYIILTTLLCCDIHVLLRVYLKYRFFVRIYEK